MEDEDEEVVLEGGQLHRYLAQTIQEDYPVYSGENRISEQTNSDFDFTNSCVIKVPYEIKQFIDILLNSSTMLEEDAFDVFLLSKRLNIKHEHKNFKTVLCYASLALTGLVTAVLKSKRNLLLPLLLGSTALTISYTRYVLTYRNLNSQLIKLSNFMNLSYSALKKRLNTLHHYVTCIRTKEGHASRKLPRELLNQKFKWARVQISVMSTDIFNALLKMLNSSRLATLDLLEIMNEKPCVKQFLNCKNDEQLGLKNILEQSKNGQLNLSGIEIMRYLNILMQSEFLRLLAYSACKLKTNTQRRKLTYILKQYEKSYEKFYLENNDHSAYNMSDLTITNPSTIVSEPTAGGNIKTELIEMVRNLRIYAHSIIVEIADVDDNLSNENIHHCEALDIAALGFDNVMEEMENLNFLLKKVKTKLGKGRNTSANVKTPAIMEPPAPFITGIEVGKSDFSISTVDEIFVGLPTTEDEIAPSSNEEHYDIDEPEINRGLQRVYDKVMSEFKVAIQMKKEEFEQRELTALKQNPNYEAYLFYEKKQSSATSSVGPEEQNDFENEVPPTFDFHKAIALNAISKSMQWKHKTNGETFFEN